MKLCPLWQYRNNGKVSLNSMRSIPRRPLRLLSLVKTPFQSSVFDLKVECQGFAVSRTIDESYFAVAPAFHLIGRSIHSHTDLELKHPGGQSDMSLQHLKSRPIKPVRWLDPPTSLHRPLFSNNANCLPIASRGASSRSHGAN